MSDWIAAATSYSTNNRVMIPFYIFYSMFGFQRIGDLAWAAGDMQARGFLLGATSGRTTLNGEGLQHQDGHSHLMSATIPNCVSYDPTYRARAARSIMQHGLKRMVEDQENVWYYLTVMNENYPHPGLKKGQEEGILKGMYLLREGIAGSGKGLSIPRVQLLGCGTILREVLAAQEMLEKDWNVAGDVWSVTSFTRTAPRRYRGGALEPHASHREAAQGLCDAAAREDRRAGGRLERLHAPVRGPDPLVHSQGPRLSRPRHRRLRPQRYARETA